MQAKHTPGPWVAHGYPNGSRQIGPAEPFGVVCEVWSAIGTDSADAIAQADANERLIAAAPDLLAALQRLDRIDRGLDAWHEDARAEAWQQGRAAIAKATGGAA